MVGNSSPLTALEERQPALSQGAPAWYNLVGSPLLFVPLAIALWSLLLITLAFSVEFRVVYTGAKYWQPQREAPLYGPVTVAQRFQVPFDDLSEVGVILDPVQQSGSEPVLVQVFVDSSAGRRELLSREVAPQGVQTGNFTSVQFTPQPHSSSQIFLLQLSAPRNDKWHGRTVWSAPVSIYAGGQLYRNGKPVAGTLMFTAAATRRIPLFTAIPQLLDRISQYKPQPFKTPWVLLYFFAYLLVLPASVAYLLGYALATLIPALPERVQVSITALERRCRLPVLSPLLVVTRPTGRVLHLEDARTAPPQQSPVAFRSGLRLLLVLTFLKGLVWIAAIPLWHGPDEPFHFAYLQYIAEENRLPVRTLERVLDFSGEIDPATLPVAPPLQAGGMYGGEPHPFAQGVLGPGESSLDHLSKRDREAGGSTLAGGNPPLYYLLSALIYKLLGRQNILWRVFALRLFSLLLSLGTVALAGRFALRFFRQNGALALSAAAAVSFQPMFTHITTLVNLDSLSFLLATAVLLLASELCFQTPSLRLGLVLGVVLGLGWLTKIPAAAGVPVIALALMNAERRQWIVVLRFGAGVVGALAVVIAPWHYFLWQTYHRWGSAVQPAIVTPGAVGSSRFPTLGAFLMQYYSQVIKPSYGFIFGASYWGSFGWGEVALDPWWYAGAALLLLFGFLGLVRLCVPYPGGRIQRLVDGRIARIGVTALLSMVIIIIVIDLLFFYDSGYSFGLQGRYFLPPLAATSTLLVAGSAAFSSTRWQPLVGTCVPLALLCFNCAALLATLDVFYLAAGVAST